MQVSRFGRDVDIACCRSVVKVAIPQRRGNELPITAIRRSGVMSVRPHFQLISGRRRSRRQNPSFALRLLAAMRPVGPVPDRRSGSSPHRTPLRSRPDQLGQRRHRRPTRLSTRSARPLRSPRSRFPDRHSASISTSPEARSARGQSAGL